MLFACKKFNINEILKCSFNLNKTEIRLLEFLFKSENAWTVNNIAENIHLDRSSVQKAIKKLHNKELISRIQKNKSAGGYIYYYLLDDKNRLKEKIIHIINEWVEVVRMEVRKWD